MCQQNSVIEHIPIFLREEVKVVFAKYQADISSKSRRHRATDDDRRETRLKDKSRVNRGERHIQLAYRQSSIRKPVYSSLSNHFNPLVTSFSSGIPHLKFCSVGPREKPQPKTSLRQRTKKAIQRSIGE